MRPLLRARSVRTRDRQPDHTGTGSARRIVRTVLVVAIVSGAIAASTAGVRASSPEAPPLARSSECPDRRAPLFTLTLPDGWMGTAITREGLDRLADALSPTWPALVQHFETADPETAFPPGIDYVAYDLLPADLERYPTGFNVAHTPLGRGAWGRMTFDDRVEELAEGYQEDARDVLVEYLDLPIGRAARVSGRMDLGGLEGFGQTYVVDTEVLEFQPYFETTWDQRDAFIPVFESIMRSFRPLPPEAMPPVLSHADRQLEGLIPDRIAGRPLYTWSVRGDKLLQILEGCDGVADDGRGQADDVASLDLDRVSAAVAGRDNPSSDPPYFIWAFRFDDTLAERVPLHFFLGAAQGGWTPIRLGGKEVMQGTMQMIEQGESIRGRPYLYDVGAIRFVVVTADQAWAEEALTDLP